MKRIDFKTTNTLAEELLTQGLVTKLEKKSFFSNLFSTKEFADIYFYNGSQLDKETIEKIKKAKVVIVNSKVAKEQVFAQTQIDDSKIKIIYPSINTQYRKPKVVKEEFIKKHNLNKKKKIILFTAKNLKSSGVKEFIDLMISLTVDNFQIIIAGEKTQVYSLKFQISKYNFGDKLLLLEDYEDMDELFLASDIFILPTYNKNFASNILKAMFCKCAVFITKNNAASEMIDVFSKMESPTDRSMQFKVDALLQNKDDLKLIKKQNRKIAKEYTLENNLKKFDEILSRLDS